MFFDTEAAHSCGGTRWGLGGGWRGSAPPSSSPECSAVLLTAVRRHRRGGARRVNSHLREAGGASGFACPSIPHDAANRRWATHLRIDSQSGDGRVSGQCVFILMSVAGVVVSCSPVSSALGFLAPHAMQSLSILEVSSDPCPLLPTIQMGRCWAGRPVPARRCPWSLDLARILQRHFLGGGGGLVGY